MRPQAAYAVFPRGWLSLARIRLPRGDGFTRTSLRNYKLQTKAENFAMYTVEHQSSSSALTCLICAKVCDDATLKAVELQWPLRARLGLSDLWACFVLFGATEALFQYAL